MLLLIVYYRRSKFFCWTLRFGIFWNKGISVVKSGTHSRGDNNHMRASLRNIRKLPLSFLSNLTLRNTRNPPSCGKDKAAYMAQRSLFCKVIYIHIDARAKSYYNDWRNRRILITVHTVTHFTLQLDIGTQIWGETLHNDTLCFFANPSIQ